VEEEWRDVGIRRLNDERRIRSLELRREEYIEREEFKKKKG